MFCKAVTGGAFTKRVLYTDLDQLSIVYQRPMIVTCLEIPSGMGDFHRRMLKIEMDKILPGRLKSELQIRQGFEERRRVITGALLDLMAKALEILPGV